MRREPARVARHWNPERRVRAVGVQVTGAPPERAQDVAQVEGTERLMECGREAGGWRAREAKLDAATDRRHGAGGVRFEQRREPDGARERVVIEEHGNLAACLGEPAVPGRREAESRLTYDAQGRGTERRE